MTVTKNPYVYYVISNGFQVVSQKPLNRKASRAVTPKRLVELFSTKYIKCRSQWEEHFSNLLSVSICYGFWVIVKTKFQRRPFWKWWTDKKFWPRICNQDHKSYYKNQFRGNRQTFMFSTNLASNFRPLWVDKFFRNQKWPSNLAFQ